MKPSNWFAKDLESRCQSSLRRREHKVPIEFDVRYFLEHKAMPRALYATGAQLMASLMQSKGAAVRGFYRKAERANPSYQCPYSDKDFSVDYQEFTNKKDSALIIRIRMPKPEISPLCRAVYLCYGKKKPENMYFTSELSPSGDYCLCGWTRDDVHLNFGDSSAKEFDRVAELFGELTQNA